MLMSSNALRMLTLSRCGDQGKLYGLATKNLRGGNGMSDLKTFLTTDLGQDAELQATLDNINDRDAFWNTLAEAARNKGYDVSADDVKAFIAAQTEGAEVSDAELETVAGGRAKGNPGLGGLFAHTDTRLLTTCCSDRTSTCP